MEDRLRQHLDRVFARDFEIGKDAFDRAIRDLDAELAFKGTFWSGFRVRRSVELMKEGALEFLAKARDEAVSRSATDRGAFELIRCQVAGLQSYFDARIPKIARNTGGASQPKSRTADFERLLRAEFDKQWAAIDAELQIVAFDFGADAEPRQGIDDRAGDARPTEDPPSDMRPEPPHWLNRFQAVAWAVYRTDEAIVDIDSWHAKAGETFYGDRPSKGARQELLDALQTGALQAHGRIDGGKFDEIPAVEWSRLRIDALDARYVHPYKDIRIALSELKRILPPSGTAPAPDVRKPVSQKLLQAWWDGLSDEIRSESQERHWELAKAEFPKNRVSRDRVRAFTLGRDPGPRPSGGKATAE